MLLLFGLVLGAMFVAFVFLVAALRAASKADQHQEHIFEFYRAGFVREEHT